MRYRSYFARPIGPIRRAFSVLAVTASALILAALLPLAAIAEQGRGIDATFFAPGGSLDQQLPAEIATAPASLTDAQGAEGAIGASGTAAASNGSSAGSLSAAVPEENEAPGIPLDAGDLAYSGVRLFVGLSVVIALIYAINAFLRRTRSPLVAGSGLVRRLAMESIGPNQVINIVEVSGKVIVVGVTDKGMTMLTELQGEAADRARLVHSRAAAGNGGPGQRGAFGAALRQFTGNWLGGKLEPQASSAPGMGRSDLRDDDFLAPATSYGEEVGRRKAGQGRATRSSSSLPLPSAAVPASAADPQNRRKRLDERASAFLAQQQDLIRGLNL